MSDETRYLNHLLDHAKQDSPKALDEMCRALEERLRGIIQSYLWKWPREDQEDILQNAMLVFAERYDKIEDNPHRFVLRVMRNKVGDAIRRVKAGRNAMDVQIDAPGLGGETRSEPVFVSQDSPESEYNSHIDAAEMLGRVRIEAVRLPRFCRMFFAAMLEGK